MVIEPRSVSICPDATIHSRIDRTVTQALMMPMKSALKSADRAAPDAMATGNSALAAPSAHPDAQWLANNSRQFTPD
jgi:hypothetical protein